LIVIPHEYASIGIAMYPNDAENIDDLIKDADKAMYEAKRDGKNIYRLASQADKS